jgi:hypothetical protein
MTRKLKSSKQAEKKSQTIPEMVDQDLFVRSLRQQLLDAEHEKRSRRLWSRYGQKKMDS